MGVATAVEEPSARLEVLQGHSVVNGVQVAVGGAVCGTVQPGRRLRFDAAFIFEWKSELIGPTLQTGTAAHSPTYLVELFGSKSFLNDGGLLDP